MSWSDPLRLIALLALAGCGFTPALGPGAPAAALRGSVEVAGGETEFDYRLRTALEDRLGQGSSYVLAVTASTDEVQAAVSPDGTITRYNITGRAEWSLVDGTGALVAEGVAGGFTSYLTTGSTVSTEAAQQDAVERLTVALADQIVTRLIIAVDG